MEPKRFRTKEEFFQHLLAVGFDVGASKEELIRFARLQDDTGQANPLTVLGSGENLKHPALASHDRGEFLIAWTEGRGWGEGGSVAWQAYDASGKPVPDGSGNADGLWAWGVPAVIADREGGFTLIY